MNKFIKKIKSFKKWIVADKKRWIVGIAVILLAIFGIWKTVSSSSNEITYQTETIEKGTLVSTVSVSGKVVTSNILEIKTTATGVVKKVYVKDGQTVYKGQKIAEITLDSSGMLANAKAKASLDSANNNYRSSQASLAKTYEEIDGHDTDETLTMKETRTKAEVANDNAWSNLASAQLTYNLSSPIVVSPYSGVISNLNIVEGVNISVEKRIATVSTKGNPVVELSLSEVDVNKVKVGQKATVNFDSLSDKSFTGVVVTVDKVGQVTSNVTNYTAYIKLDSSSDELLSNMAGTANIILDSVTDVLIIPSAAIQTNNDINYAKILKDGKQELVEITLGLSTDNGVEVKSGLKMGETVITGTNTTRESTATTTKSVFSSVGGGGMGIPR